MTTELFINRMPVVLPQGFSITYIEENYFFTKNGKYTYDITLSLLNPRNAIVYAHLNRINRKDAPPKDRTAYLVVDGEVVMNGTEVILSYTDTEVKIQLVSGNSDLNFLGGSDRNIRDLDLGEAPDENWVFRPNAGEEARQWSLKLEAYYEQDYPEREYQYLPVFTPTSSFDGKFTFDCQNKHEFVERIQGINQPSPEINVNYIPQPYFCFIIRKVIEYFNYKMVYNALEDTVFRQTVMVHGIDTRQYARMLPDWTVEEFLNEVELVFDCTFVVNDFDRTARLLFNYQNDEQNTQRVSLQALDEFEVEMDEENTLTVRNQNLRYALDETDNTKFANLPEAIYSKAINTPVITGDLFAMVNDSSDELREQRIYNAGNNRFIAYNTSGSNYIAKKVHWHPPLYNNPGGKDTIRELRIVPAMFYSVVQNSDMEDQVWIQMPYVAEADDRRRRYVNDEKTAELFNLQELIENEASETEVIPSKIRLVLYSGLKKLDKKKEYTGNATYGALSYVEDLIEYFDEAQLMRSIVYAGNPFRLQNMQENIYSRARKIDTTSVHKIKFVNNRKLDITSIFVVNNKAYRCQKVERKINEKGFDPVANGFFYPLE
ncbi:hypothetical protein M2132_001831 [Dysgonomonas sp. PH5-45]|uniref:hypothetical protein n=1 Tax=unclassified Dysgonomonas TaxID=2630389 RepID=UPI002473166C|nr:MULTISPECIES: hypothetical protein [unclassified Dysgonomonas]MDH6355488.1 hypothetical protein [Dysgonomonas sp. PH5-45]MDH6388384.1 hypothetical protein [Dysgonomonas sp. PH5-37]